MPVIDLRQLRAGDETAGGKGAALGELIRSGFPVPNGFVIPTSEFDRCIEGKLSDELSRDILAAFAALGVPRVAVRSSATAEDSATAAWAGQLDTFLNTTRENLLENVKRCWASLSAPRTVSYRCEKGLQDTPISVAVIVQEMVQSEVSGVAFSVHPVTEDRNQMVIEAGFGLGEAIVSGQVTPDKYVVDKSLRIVEKLISDQGRGLFLGAAGNEWRPVQKKQKLSNEQIRELAELVLKVEKHCGFPVDVEWVYADGKFLLTQNRPITTLGGLESGDPLRSILRARKWVHYLTRPKTLFLASIWHKWYDSEVLEECVGARVPDCLMVEESPGTVAYYMDDGQLAEFWRKSEELTRQPEKLLRILEEAKALNVRAEAILAGNEAFSTLQEGVGFLVRLGVYATQTPRSCLMVADVPAEIAQLAAELRGVSYYPRIADEVLVPLAARQYGIPEEVVRKSTVIALENSSTTAPHPGSFIYTVIDGKEDVAWTMEVAKVLDELHPTEGASAAIAGTCAFPGKARGRVRIVNTSNYKALQFDPGDVLVSINSNPTYMSLIKVAGAIVTDEGGMGCHAAIVSRELRIPCVMGTGTATKILHDGDLVEVDASRGVVRKL